MFEISSCTFRFSVLIAAFLSQYVKERKNLQSSATYFLTSMLGKYCVPTYHKYSLLLLRKQLSLLDAEL